MIGNGAGTLRDHQNRESCPGCPLSTSKKPTGNRLSRRRRMVVAAGPEPRSEERPSPFALAARKDGLGEEPCARSVLSIAIMALLLTDADAKRRSSAQGSQAEGASRSWCATYLGKGINDNCSYATEQQCLAQVWGLGGFCRPNPFPGTAYGTGYSWSSGPPR
jgi:hypothetical protein